MNEVIQLDYAAAPRRKPWSLAAFIGLMLGLCSGPIMIVLAGLSGVAYGISLVGSAGVALVGIPIFGYCLWGYVRSANQGRARGRVLAMIGLIATVVWSVGLVTAFFYIDAQLE